MMPVGLVLPPAPFAVLPIACFAAGFTATVIRKRHVVPTIDPFAYRALAATVGVSSAVAGSTLAPVMLTYGVHPLAICAVSFVMWSVARDKTDDFYQSL